MTVKLSFSGSETKIGSLCLTASLPPVASAAHQCFYIDKYDTNAASYIVVIPTGSDPWYGWANAASVRLSGQGSMIGIYSDGTTWHTIAVRSGSMTAL